MAKKKVIGCIVTGVAVATAITAKVMENKAKKTTYKAENINPVNFRKMGFYEKYIKRAIDITCATGAIVVFSPLYLGVAFLVRTKLGSPVLFTQDRPGLIGPDGKETVFKMYKFRSMTDERDENGELLPDDVRLTKFGKWLRNTSLDELPEAFNILNGLRPGEKLYEELLVKTEELDKTDNSLIFIERDTALSKEEIYRKIDVLRNACDTGDDLIAKEALRSVVPTFKTPEEVNKEIA